MADSLWGAEFTFKFAKAFAEKAEIYNPVGCLMRAATQMTQALFALNEKYFLSDKKVVETMTSFNIIPVDHVKQIKEILACPGKTRSDLSHSVVKLEATW